MARTQAKDHRQKQARILKIAAREFAREGIVRASMGQVAEACNISKANIYHYYDGKNALVFGILDDYLRSLRDRVCGVQIDGLSSDQKLRILISEVLFAYEGMDDQHKIQTEGLRLLPAAQQEILRGYQRDLVQIFSNVLKSAAPEVFAGEKEKLRATTMSVFGMLNWFYMWNNKARAEMRKEYADLVTSLTLGGLHAI